MEGAQVREPELTSLSSGSHVPQLRPGIDKKIYFFKAALPHLSVSSPSTTPNLQFQATTNPLSISTHSGSLISVESHNMWPFVLASFT